jgi:hypothetical protein
MVWGSEKTLKMLHSHFENTGTMPPALVNRPFLEIENVVYNEAFNILSSGRQNTDHVINPITFSEVMQYCDCIGEFDGEERLRYWAMICACDSAFISSALEQRSQAMKKTAKGGRRG